MPLDKLQDAASTFILQVAASTSPYEAHMKVTCNPFIYAGTCDGLVYYYHKRLGTMIARKYVYPRQSSQNLRIAAISRNLKALEISPGYKNDLNTYIALASFNQNKQQLLNWRNAFISLMFALAKQNPQLDLLTLTKAQIVSLGLPCLTVKDAVQAGLLPFVEGCDRLDSEM